MFITADESEQDSPLQALLEGAWCILKFNKLIESLDEKPSTHTQVQEAVNNDN